MPGQTFWSQDSTSSELNKKLIPDPSALCSLSDDRSAEVFQKRIDAATQMRSVLGANERPNCLIIDEIDGAPAVTA